MGVKVKYKGSQIVSMDASGTKTLNTNGTYCEGDISVQYEKPTASEVTSGTKSITTNGEYDVTSYASANVSVLPNVRYFELNLTADKSATWVDFNPSGDADIAAHRADATMCVSWHRVESCDAATYHHSSHVGNTAVNSYYGSCLLKTSSGASGTFVNTPLTADTSAVAKKTIINTSGVVRAYTSTNYPMRAGKYVCIVSW